MKSLIRRTSLTFPYVEGEDYRVDASGCWIWLGRQTRNGYGLECRVRMREEAGTQYAHRAAWCLTNGIRLDDLGGEVHIHHRCHTPLCVNPSHLALIDRVTHLREHRYDESVLTKEQVIEMRERAWAGEHLPTLAEAYPVSYKTVHDICHGVTWQDVGGPVGTAPRYCKRCGDQIERKHTRRANFCSNDCRVQYWVEVRRKAA